MPRSIKKYNERIELGRDPSGKRIRKWVRADTKAEFEAKKYELRKEWEAVRNPSAITFGAYADQWIETYKGNRERNTQNFYNNCIKKLDPIRHKQLKTVTASDLQQIINNDWDHPRTCINVKLTLQQIYKQAIKDGIIYPINLAEDLDLPKLREKVTRFITDDEMTKILQIKFDPQEKLYVDVLRNTGMRPSEALALRYEDIQDDHIHVCRSFEYDGSETKIKGTKTNTERDIPLNKTLRSALTSDGQNEGFVFTKNGKPFTRSDYVSLSHKILYKIRKVIGDNTITIYSFRHTFATRLYYHGCRPGIISTKMAAQIMGHSEKMFISRYTHIDDTKESAAAVIEKIGELSCPNLAQEDEN